MQVSRARARRLSALVASVALGATFVGTTSAAVDPQATCVRSAPGITFSANPLTMAPSGMPSIVAVTITDLDSPGCTAFQTWDWQWQPKKVSGAPGITAVVVGNSGAAIKGGQSFTTYIRVYAFAPVGSTAQFSFTAVRMDRPTLTPTTVPFAVRVARPLR